MIEIQGLFKQYGKEPVFSNFNLTLSASKVCIQAPNGRGKSTLFRIIAGVEEGFSGQIKFKVKRGDRRDNVALASDGLGFPPFLTAKQVLELTQFNWHCHWPLELIERFNFTAFLEHKVSTLSSGNQKKLQLINAMMRNTPILILDEPSAALDAQGLLSLLDWCREFKGQLVISSHEPSPFIDIGFSLQPLDGEK
ncbi:ATP-binding cassette domain-containing protein [Pseudoalteromonas xiamenensis]|uniref:ABC transporter ATP-binding protein n=1 Tax=Pseudoalteromonas xiamenensis TaxID=882626 RepID=UPI0027E57FCE|nr:ATP-binding cassette domain-containing protein [Pseudoalteromonas xiamenensis]WMN60342.1 ATP-binding cassette domain-containing protein [Pseudoalteromonas xiamenensis]